MSESCVFCKIIRGDFGTEFLAETEHTVAFQDISPRAPIHILVVPKVHHENVAELAFADPDALVDLVQVGSQLALQHSTGSFRLTFNTGKDAGQTVFHTHGHVTSRTPKN
ncbi:MAG: HIT domain-containing protein [Micrococcales bacterium]